MDALRGPNWLGVNVTLIVQFAPGARLAPHVLALWLNSAGSDGSRPVSSGSRANQRGRWSAGRATIFLAAAIVFGWSLTMGLSGS